jgi:26S proteasome regulatory subunit N3
LVAIDADCSFLERAVERFDSRFTLRALRSISALRKKLDAKILFEAIITRYNFRDKTAGVLIKATGIQEDDARSVQKEVEKRTGIPLEKDINKKDVIPEVDIYLAILIQVCGRMVFV